MSSEILETIYQKYRDFLDQYKTPPSYIKIPEWALERLKAEYLTHAYIPDYFQNKLTCFMGMTVCPTFVIEKLEDIELF